MLTINSLNNFLAEIKNNIPAVNFTETVIDDSQLTSFLKERTESDNQYCVAVIPDYGINGSQDTTKWNNQLMFFFLAKYSDKDLTHAQKIQLMADVQNTAQLFVNFILLQKSGDNGTICGIMNELVENSIIVTPVWEKAQCSGWIVEIDLLTRV